MKFNPLQSNINQNKSTNSHHLLNSSNLAHNLHLTLVQDLDKDHLLEDLDLLWDLVDQ